ncbi:transporter substrate-binding domain-containing protein [uncultured Psychromonas sp.]|uniref:transporter substrate-binding domain-containing protein n=1 Tax=uncultured Psychromonas sp. TaxID=173974 RepID=UPI00261FFEE4|nr:transporter substrate-binding domain-containing protein [uncultured Psychromonas sp.]
MISFSRQIGFLCLLLSTSLSANTPKQLQVKFATDANYFPFEYLSDNKKIEGFDIDIAKAICEQANLKCSFEHHRFDGLLLTLPFGRYDAVIAALDITSERLEKVDFSDSYYKVPPVFISKEQLQGKFSLAGKFIGVQANTSNQNYLIKFAKENSYIVSYYSSQAALNDLKQARIDAVFADFAVINDFLSKQEDNSLVISRTEAVFIEQFSKGYGIAVKKNNHVLRDRLNLGLKLIVENGTYAKIFQSYFP